MRIALLATGTRGDAQPLIVLADQLRRIGYDTVLGLSPNLVPLAQRAGLIAYPVGPDSQDVLESPEGRRWLAAGNVGAFMAELGNISRAHAEQTSSELLSTCEGADLIVAGVLCEDHLAVVAQAQRVPLVCLHYAPLRPTRGYPPLLMTTRQLPPVLNLAAHALFQRIWWRGQSSSGLDELCRRLSVPLPTTPTPRRLKASGVLELQMFSSALTPRLQDYPARRPILGFSSMHLELRSRLGEDSVDADLEQVIDAGEPPAYFGFGSMPVGDPEAMLATISRTARRLGLRALVGAGWSHLDQVDGTAADVRVVRGLLNFETVFPRCRIAVHHGGSGTVAASVTSGTPTLVCSVFADNAFWGARVSEVGVGAHQPFVGLTEVSLEAGLRAVLRPEIAARAKEVGALLRRDSGADKRAAQLVGLELQRVGGS